VAWVEHFAKLELRLREERALLIPVALVFAAGVAAVAMFFYIRDTSSLVSHTLEVRIAASDLLTQMQDAETGERGFLLTGQSEFLEPYQRAMPQIRPALAKLRKLMLANPAQHEILGRLSTLIATKTAVIEEVLTLTRQGKKREAADLADPSKNAMDDIRSLIGQIEQAEKDKLAGQERADQFARGVLLLLILAGLAGASVLAGLALTTQARLLKNLQDEAKRREVAEASLRQAQKMEAVGQLTGGVAHDFNNLLTIILGNLDSVRRKLPVMAEKSPASLARPIDAAIAGARNAAKLTHRLLAFSRLQPLDPVALDLNKCVTGVSDLLTRTAGSPVTIETALADGLWLTMADANQLENVLVNLAVNAKDAMPDGGRITIETANAYLDEGSAAAFGDAAPGRYVVLSVTDTGTGIPPEILPRVFDPFFTTKEPGLGTGLGLSMVHGFVKQTGGQIRIYSEAGHGTAVKIYLPVAARAEQAGAPKTPAPDPKPLAPATGSETVLVVEDNPSVLEFACRALEEAGYRVIAATGGPDAMKHLEGGGEIGLLFTDVVMSKEMTGGQLAEAARGKRPELPVLFTSGYSRNAIVRQGGFDASVSILNKPYTQDELLRKVRTVLDEANRGGSNHKA
jgi:signal transduction histidine kinase